MDTSQETKTYKTFIIAMSIAIILALSGIFFGVSLRTKYLIDEEILTQARAHFNSIVMTRKWNANYGGVYVEKKAGMESNPYLEHPDIKTTGGKVYTLKNPALMTREISQYSEKEGLFSFHITSLKLLNPDNKPDEFEKDALLLFERGEKEFFQKESRNNRTYFRYMSPLYGYKIGDIRGGISVTFDIEDVQMSLKNNIFIITMLGFISASILLGFLYFFTIRLTKKISDARQKIEEMAITDELTEQFNRRHIMERFRVEFERAKRLKKDLGCILIDIDNFKSVNDQYGHLVGDELLREVSGLIKDSIRTYDILGRYGGEEFLIVLPDTKLDDARNLAERTRLNIKENVLLKSEVFNGKLLTISLGITRMKDTDLSVDDIIKRADEGLYKAKNTGRDRVECV
jgi:diguanylate cyclase (GGDEF)-like protein